MYECHKSLKNPYFDLMNFDNIYHCILVIFQLLTGQGISQVYTYLNKTFKDDYYISKIIIDIFIFGNSFILLVVVFFYIAILKNIFTEEEKLHRKELPKKISFTYYLLNKKLQDDDEDYDDPADKAEKEKKLKRDLSKIPTNSKTCREITNLKNLRPKEKDEVFEIITTLSTNNTEKLKRMMSLKRTNTKELKKMIEKKFNIEQTFLYSEDFQFILQTGKESINNIFRQINRNFEAIMMCNPIFKVFQHEIEKNNDEDDDSDLEVLDEDGEGEEKIDLLAYNLKEKTKKDTKEGFSINNKILVLPSERTKENLDEDVLKLDSSTANNEISLNKHRRSKSIKIRRYKFDVLELEKYKYITNEKFNLIRKEKLLKKYTKQKHHVYNLLNTDFDIEDEKFKLNKLEDNRVILE